jgi:hypothetical protein
LILNKLHLKEIYKFINILGRTKRLSQKEILEIEKDQLEEDIDNLSHENEVIKVQLNAFKQRFDDLQTYSKILKTKLGEKLAKDKN